MKTEYINYIIWNKEYSIDVLEIDLQHKELMNLVNNSISHCLGSAKSEKKYFDKIVNESIKFLEKHFSTEEQIFDRTGYDKKEEHKKEHETIFNKMTAISNDLKDDKKEMDLFTLITNLKEWLLSHILAYDKTAKEYFKEGIKKVSP